MGPVGHVVPFGLVGSFGRVEPCDCVSTSRPFGCVGSFGRVGPCGCVSTSRPFGRVGPVGHLVFQFDAVAASYCTTRKWLTGWPKRPTGWDKRSTGSASSVL